MANISEWLQNIALLIVVFGIRCNRLSLLHTYKMDEETLAQQKQWDCQLAPGMDLAKEKGHFYGTEDVELDRESNLAFATVGFRELIFTNFHKEHKQLESPFTGIYVYDYSDPEHRVKEPTKIEIPSSNPHGLDLFKLKNGNIRVFVVSHIRLLDDGSQTGDDEVIIFDFDIESKSVVGDFTRVKSDEFLWAANDIHATSPNSFISSQWQPFAMTPENLWKNDLMFKLTLTDYGAVTFVEFDEKTGEVVKGKKIANMINNPNGIKYEAKTRRIYVNQHHKARTAVLNWNHLYPMEPAKVEKLITYPKGFVPDNSNIDAEGKFMYVTGFANGFSTIVNPWTANGHVESYVFKLDLTEHTFEPIFYDEDGSKSFSIAAQLDASTFLMGSPHKNLFVCKML